MIYTSLKEEWPYQHEAVYLRWTEDGVIYKEEVVAESRISDIFCLGVPEWRPIETPEWLTKEIKDELCQS